jgi:hypothetical protein
MEDDVNNGWELDGVRSITCRYDREEENIGFLPAASRNSGKCLLIVF